MNKKLILFGIVLLMFMSLASAITYDDFNRVNNATIGNGWTESQGTWDINNNMAQLTTSSDDWMYKDLGNLATWDILWVWSVSQTQVAGGAGPNGDGSHFNSKGMSFYNGRGGAGDVNLRIDASTKNTTSFTEMTPSTYYFAT